VTTSVLPNRFDHCVNSNRVRVVRLRAEGNMKPTTIEVERSGDWLPADELRDKSLQLLDERTGVTLNLDKVDHLDASVLQILLALDIEHKKQGQQLHLEKASPSLRQWFEYAGAAGQFDIGRRSGDE
jgi:anti-anti-sigma regulatory factor